MRVTAYWAHSQVVRGSNPDRDQSFLIVSSVAMLLIYIVQIITLPELYIFRRSLYDSILNSASVALTA
jgi:hypothetical protein